MDAFGPTLDYFCERQGITLKELADQMGVSRNTIGNWKGRGKPPNQEITVKLAKKLNLDEDETDTLLASAQYAPKYKKSEITPSTQYGDVRAKHIVVDHLEVRGDLTKQNPPRRCDYYAHISIPPNFVERSDVIKVVREKLLGDAPTVALTSALQYIKPNALHGMGGIGKTVIARALCDDPTVQAAFPDGILWVTLGQTPELIPIMRSWVHVLGGTISENVPTLDSLKNSLAKLLKNRSCLLILDDVWQRTHAEAFCVAMPQGRLLLTTRDAEIARELGAKVQPIPIMTEAEAI